MKTEENTTKKSLDLDWTYFHNYANKNIMHKIKY